MLRYARSRVYDGDDAEDLCSEAWLRFVENYNTPDAIRGEPVQVLFGILRHLLAGYYRRKKKIRTALLILEDRTESISLETQTIMRDFEDHVIACLFGLNDTLKLAWLLKFDPGRVEWIAVLLDEEPDVVRALLRQSESREIFIDEPRAADLMHMSVWSYRRNYEKAQRIMNDLMRKNGWEDMLNRHSYGNG